LRKILFLIVIVLAAWFIYTQIAEFEQIGDTLKEGEWGYLLLGVLIALAWITLSGVILNYIYKVVGLNETWLHMVVTTSAGFFVNVVSTGGVASILAVQLVEGKRRGNASSRVTVAWAINMLFETVGLLSVVILGLAVLARRNNLYWGEMTGFFFLLAIAAGLSIGLYLAMKSARILSNVLAWCVERLNWLLRPILKRELIAPDNARLFAYEAADGVVLLRKNPRQLVILSLMAIFSKALLMLIFLVCFLAYQLPFSPGTIVAGFSLGYQFVVVSPTPSGIGIVESVWPLFLRTLGVEPGADTVIMLTFRAFTFWLPLLVGFVCFRLLPAMPKNAASEIAEIQHDPEIHS